MHFPKLDVAGSIPVSRSRISNLQASIFRPYSVYSIKRRPPSIGHPASRRRFIRSDDISTLVPGPIVVVVAASVLIDELDPTLEAAHRLRIDACARSACTWSARRRRWGGAWIDSTFRNLSLKSLGILRFRQWDSRGHCQVDHQCPKRGLILAGRSSDGNSAPSCEGTRPQHSVMNRPESVPTQPEKIQNETVNRKESLSLGRRLEPSHLPLPLSSRLV